MYLQTKNNFEWKQINYRNVDTMLSVQFIYDLYDQYSSTINWFRFKNVCLYFQDDKLWSYTPIDEWNDALDNIAEQFINPKENSNPDIIKNCFWYYNRKEKLLDKFLKRHSKTNLSKLSDMKLYKLLFNWYQITLNQIYFINLAPVELGLQRAINNLNVNDYLTADEISILYSLDDNTAVIREEYAFLKRISTSKGKVDIDTLIASHIEEYGYITIGYGSKPLSKDFLKKRYEKLISNGDDKIEQRISEIENYPNKIAELKEKTYKKLDNSQLAELFNLAAKLGYMRDRKKAYLGKAVEFRNIILEEIISRKAISKDELKYYILEEIKTLLLNNSKLSSVEIDKRSQGVYIEHVSSFNSGDMAREKYFGIVNVKNEDKDILNSRKGVCASPGKVTGKARVCLTFEESNNLEKGEILVTYGTDFDFMNAILKSSGIITEEGGILSHASVISRELNKPCVIAYQGITKIIKTGDIIELDAEFGSVKIISSIEEDSSKNKNNIIGVYDLTTNVDSSEIGNKAYNLSKLYRLNYNVPEAYFLGISFFENLLKNENKYDDYIKYLNDIKKYKNNIYEIIETIKLPKELFHKLDFKNNTYAVRSSSPNEDGEQKSFAGQFVTELFCNSEESISKGIRNCWKSLLGVGLEEYQNNNLFMKFGGIILQKMIVADFAGVMFTKNPVSNNKDCIIIESCKGVASKLVDNIVVPDRYFINEDTLEIIDSIAKNDIPVELIKKLALIGKELEQEYKSDVDIEWACKDGIIYLIQCRPITT